MRVLLDTTFARRGPSGTGVYVTKLAGALRAAGVEVVEVANERRRPPGTGSARNLLDDMRWWQGSLRRLARDAEVDVVHHPLPAHVVGLGVPQVVTVHDLAFLSIPSFFDPRFVAFAARWHRLSVARAAAVIAVSRATADDVGQAWGVRALVAPHGPGQELGSVARGEPRHWLYVGDAEPRKDLPTLLEAYARYRSLSSSPLPLVLAGSAFAVDSGVRVVERPSTDELRELYAGAAALVHPSRHEGFGLTIAEALDTNTPIIAADTTAVRELAEGAARLVEPGDATALTSAFLNPPPPPDAEPPTWHDSAQAHIEAYRLAGKQ